MRITPFIFCLVLLIASCSGPEESTSPEKVVINQESTERMDSSLISTTPDTINLFQFGQAIIGGKIEFLTDKRAWRCLDSLASKNSETRQFFFQVYRTISAKADGAIGEVIGGSIKGYFSDYPIECISNYKVLSADEQRAFIGWIAFEFYSSSADYKKDIIEFTGKIQEELKTPEDKSLVAEISEQIIQEAQKLYN